jgi:hypothetical protein
MSFKIRRSLLDLGGNELKALFRHRKTPLYGERKLLSSCGAAVEVKIFARKREEWIRNV